MYSTHNQDFYFHCYIENTLTYHWALINSVINGTRTFYWYFVLDIQMYGDYNSQNSQLEY